MIKRLRRRLRMIRYHSASRNDTLWTRLGDLALLVSLLLAVPAAWWSDRTFTRIEPAYSATGIVQKSSDGRFRVEIASPHDTDRDFNIPFRERHASFMIDVERMIRGLPLETSQVTRLPTVDLREYGTARRMTEVDTSRGSAMRDALIDGLERSQLDEAAPILDLWRRDAVLIEHDWRAWAANSLLWWISLFVVFSVGLVFARLGTIMFFRSRNAKWDSRIRQGLCPYCGYDLRGLEFSERCPECGELQV